MVKCSKCKKVKDSTKFYSNKSNKNKVSDYCIECSRSIYKEKNKNIAYKHNIYDKHIRKKYNSTIEEISIMFELQNKSCKACKQPLSFPSKFTHIDHCHTSGKIRGILCRQCNVALGILKEDINHMKQLLDYLINIKTK